MDKLLEDFFGLSLLKRQTERILAQDSSNCAHWLDRNLQPARFAGLPPKKQKLLGVCPHYQLLETAAEICWIKPEEFAAHMQFCGVYFSNGRGRMPILLESGYSNFDLVVAACNILDLVLGTALNYVEMKEPSCMTIDKQSTLAELHSANGTIADWRRYKIGREILAKWKKSVPQVCLCDESEKSVIEAVRNFQRSLRQNCTADSSFLYPICAQAPTAFDMQQHREEFISLEELSRGGDEQNEP